MKPLVDWCLRCKKKPYDSSNQDHPHHCPDCVKKCAKCGNWNTLSHFHPIKTSHEYAQYLVLGGMSGSYVMRGPDNFFDVCKDCFMSPPLSEQANLIVQQAKEMMGNDIS